MPLGYRKLMKDDVNWHTAFDMACMAEADMLQRLGLPKRGNCCIIWGPDCTAICGTGLQDGLLQADQQLHRHSTLQMRVSSEGGSHRGTSLAEAGMDGMLDLSVLMEQHTRIGEGLAASQNLTSHLPTAIDMSSTKDPQQQPLFWGC